LAEDLRTKFTFILGAA
jgi:hypothetical protein